MKLFEVDPNLKLPDLESLKGVDMVDDLHFYMNNDPSFYRKTLFPIIIKLKKALKRKEKCSPDYFRKCVDKAIAQYCKKFKITGNPTSIFTDVDRDSLARKIFDQERGHINDGIHDHGGESWEKM